MSAPRIPITRPVFGDEEKDGVLRVLDSGWLVQGAEVRAFEARFAEYSGAPFAAAASSCTTALHLAVAALGLAPGDEVIVPAFTWIATPNVVEYMGARPVFCDIDLETYNLDVAHLRSLVGPKTVGVIPVHLFGLCADMAGVLEIARAHGLWVVEDAACAFGARIGDQHAGTFADAGCFSFHPRKAITTGEGGMITARDEALDRAVRSLRDHGASVSDFARHHGPRSYVLPDFNVLGYNFRMTDLQAAIGRAQMERAEAILHERRAKAAAYDRRLTAMPWLRPPSTPPQMTHGYQSYVCFYHRETPTMDNLGLLHAERNAIMRTLEGRGIATRPGTHAAALTGFYRDKYGVRPEDLPRAHFAEQLTITLPLFSGIAESDIDDICDALDSAFDASHA